MTPLQAAEVPALLVQDKRLRDHVQRVCRSAWRLLEQAGLSPAGTGTTVLHLGQHRLLVAWRGLVDVLTADAAYLCAVLELSTDPEARGACRMSLQWRSEQPPREGSNAATGECLLHVPLWATAGLSEETPFDEVLDKALAQVSMQPFMLEDPEGLVQLFTDRVLEQLVLL